MKIKSKARLEGAIIAVLNIVEERAKIGAGPVADAELFAVGRDLADASGLPDPLAPARSWLYERAGVTQPSTSSR
ncbi:MAG: hypothetical protein KKI08_11840 [Armatimonadetes bacterium]|nr:hypothetical protein [Armatimonadota bacterium]